MPVSGRSAFPKDIVPELRDHMERFADPNPRGLVFIGPKGGRLRRSNFRKFWHRARGAVGLPELHFHDLRHTGNTMAAAQGATLRELMERMGHSSPRAALIYLHATRERDERIAAGMGKLLRMPGWPGRPVPRRRDRARNGHAARVMRRDGQRVSANHAPDRRRNEWSGRRESNPHDQLGRCMAHSHQGR